MEPHLFLSRSKCTPPLYVESTSEYCLLPAGGTINSRGLICDSLQRIICVNYTAPTFKEIVKTRAMYFHI